MNIYTYILISMHTCKHIYKLKCMSDAYQLTDYLIFTVFLFWDFINISLLILLYSNHRGEIGIKETNKTYKTTSLSHYIDKI